MRDINPNFDNFLIFNFFLNEDYSKNSIIMGNRDYFMIRI